MFNSLCKMTLHNSTLRLNSVYDHMRSQEARCAPATYTNDVQLIFLFIILFAPQVKIYHAVLRLQS